MLLLGCIKNKINRPEYDDGIPLFDKYICNY